jgi:hypothetical protein
MARTELIEHLTRLPDAIRDAEEKLTDVRIRHAREKEAAACHEARMILDPCGPITGKNAEHRAAQLLLETADQRERLRSIQEEIDWAEIELRALRDSFLAYRAVARLVAGPDD